MLELYDIKQLPEGTSTVTFDIMERYKRIYPCLMKTNTHAKYKNTIFVEDRIILI